jgi:predicted alpha/beta-hydrolase family hydrolase
MKVIFSHGKESGPWGSKIKRLASTAKEFGFLVDSIDYSEIISPDERADKLCNYLATETEPFVLVGSSMGGYVSLVAADTFSPEGLFLLAPALYMDGYFCQEYKTDLTNVEIVHGWDDEVIPIANSFKFGSLAKCRVHLIDGDHRLNSSLDQINKLFLSFLEELTKLYASK